MAEKILGMVVVLCDASAETEQLAGELRSYGWGLHAVHDVDKAVELNVKEPLCVVVCDDPGRTQLDGYLQQRDGNTPVLAAVRQGDVSRAVLAMQLGAATVLEMRPGELLPSATSLVQAIDERVKPPAAWRGPDPRDRIVRAPDSPLLGMLEVMPQIARSDAPVLITGESGVGKDLFARVLHDLGPRHDAPYVALQCSAIPEHLLEAELFGVVKGAFTGANADRPGQIEAAHGGTLFLDEIGELPAHLQVKLLRVLQDRAVTPVGSTRAKAVDFRIIAATNLDIEAAVASGEFREDLYYRLNVLPIHLPALREHPQDIAPLCEHFIAAHNAKHGTHIVGVTRETRTLLKRYQWPGNVRELENFIERLCVLKRSGFIERDDLGQQILESPPMLELGLDVPSEGIDMTNTLDRLERSLLARALQKAEGNKARAARLLGINRTTLVEKLKRKQIELDTTEGNT